MEPTAPLRVAPTAGTPSSAGAAAPKLPRGMAIAKKKGGGRAVELKIDSQCASLLYFNALCRRDLRRNPHQAEVVPDAS